MVEIVDVDPKPAKFVTLKLQDYFAVSPSGRQVRISRELFEALELALTGKHPAAHIEIDTRNQGVAGVRITHVLKG